MTATILYYTSNREDRDFERRIQKLLLNNCGRLPIISISQKPLSDMGKNIYVGDVGVSGFNMFRQIQRGLQEATTDFIISAEADCLYPPDYFEYEPPYLDRCYRDSSLYVMPDYRNFFFKKPKGATHTQIIGREYYLERLNELFNNAPEWSPEEKNFPKERWRRADIFDEIELFETKNPVVQIKTHKGMRYYTESDRVPRDEIPYWGQGRALRDYYIKGIV